jgi:hypothetical protein
MTVVQAELEVRSVVLVAKVAKLRSAIEAERGKAAAELAASEADFAVAAARRLLIRGEW